MSWTLTDDVEDFAPRALPLLAAKPVENTLALTVLHGVLAGRRHSSEAMLFGWYDDGCVRGDDRCVRGAVMMTPPFEMILAALPADTTSQLVAALRSGCLDIPGVSGEVGAVDAFAAAWTDGTSMRASTAMRLRLYKLTELRHPPRPPAGRPRLAASADAGLAAQWMTAFQTEAGAHQADVEAVVRERIDDGLLWLWDGEAGDPVSLAGRQKTAGGVARVGPVYTPPEHRRLGFGAAVTVACTEDALQRDAEHVVLFTDLANPTSNSIYQQIGFQPVEDRHVVRFTNQA